MPEWTKGTVSKTVYRRGFESHYPHHFALDIFLEEYLVRILNNDRKGVIQYENKNMFKVQNRKRDF